MKPGEENKSADNAQKPAETKSAEKVTEKVAEDKVALKSNGVPKEGQDKGDESKREFPVKQALALLNARKSRWTLADDKYTFEAGELSKKGK